MFLSNFSIRNPLATVVLIIAMMVMGLLALSKLKVNQNPDVAVPGLSVVIPYPGSSPDTSEREIVNRLEKQLMTIPGVKDLYSTSGEGSAQFDIMFEFSKNMVEATDEVRNAISSVRYKLPTEMREPYIVRWDPSAQPVVNIALSSSKLSHAEISRMAEDKIADKLRAIPGVANVKVNGTLKRELSVLLRAEKLREFNVSVGEVVNALRLQNANAPVGKISGDLEEESIRLVGRIETPEEFQNVVIKRSGDQIVRLGQVASIQDHFADLNSLSIRSGKPNVSLQVTKSREASAVSVAKRVREYIETANKEMESTMPGTKMDVTFDGGKNAKSSLNNVVESLIFGAVLTVFVVYVFLNSWRSTLITALSLPTSVLAAFIAVWLCGFTLNFMTLLGLSLAIGVLIDDAIVVRENIVRHMQNGSDRRTAAMEGTAEIGLAVAATTFSIVAVFVPVAFMGGMPGEWFRPFALTVTCSVLVSLVISFTLDPMLSAYWGDPADHHTAPKKGISKVLQSFNDWFDHQADRYGKVIAWALHHRRWMAFIAFGTLIAAFALQAKFGGTSFLPSTDAGSLMIQVRTPPSSSLEYARLKMERAAAIARALPETKETNSSITPAGGRIYVDIGKRHERKRSAKEIAADLRSRISSLVGAEYTIQDDVNNGANKPVQIEFTGPDSRKLMEITSEYMEKLAKVPGAVDIGLSQQDPKREIKIELNRGLANSMGVSASDAAQTLRIAFAGIEAGDWVDPTGETRDVAVRLHPDDRVSKANLERLPISVGGTNQMVPLDQIATITMGKGPSTIEHTNGKRTITVSANAQGRSSGEVITDAKKLAESMNFPAGYGLNVAGAGQDQEEVFGAMGIAVLSGIGLMYLILVIQFGSFTAPLGVMASLPLSLIGVVVALVSTGSTINLMSLIGVIMLMGLVAKNAILLLDAARKFEAEGMDREDALMQAGRVRLRPILMTTFALIAGMLPVAIGAGEGGDFYRPLAIAIIGGTITSTLLTLLVVPTFYDSIELSKDGALRKLKARSERYNSGFALIVTGLEVLCTVTGLRLIFRSLVKCRTVIFRSRLKQT